MTLALGPIVERVVIASERGAIDSIGHIAFAATSITFDSLGNYIHTRQSHLGLPSSKALSGTSGTSPNEAYRVVGLPVPSNVCALSG